MNSSNLWQDNLYTQKTENCKTFNEANKKKFIDGIHKYKKVGWNSQPTKCSLLKPERFSAYQMSITPSFAILKVSC